MNSSTLYTPIVLSAIDVNTVKREYLAHNGYNVDMGYLLMVLKNVGSTDQHVAQCAINEIAHEAKIAIHGNGLMSYILEDFDKTMVKKSG